ncbi:MAG: PQQ-binding-like beta-propeller repeat protein [Myxococcaceae bacterium]|nr:PQQ-binding-like beta-propeller repeat protein [Myxococcaceae bacterium]
MTDPVLIVALGGSVCGVDPKTGAWLWKNALAGGGFGEVAISVQEGYVIASASGPVVYCLDSKTGDELWRANTEKSGRATILVQEERVYVAKTGVVECFDIDGHLLWGQQLPGMGSGRLALGFPGNVVQADDVGRE